jgi:hypothetical protein
MKEGSGCEAARVGQVSVTKHPETAGFSHWTISFGDL